MVIYRFWSPKLAAWQYRVIALTRHMKAEAYALQAFHDGLAPPQTYVVTSDLVQPVLANVAGDEMCLVNMKYVVRGIYKLTSIRFVTKQG